MYTWGYIKESALAKLDMSNDEAVEIGLVNKFVFYANEAMTQICSAIKPNRTFAIFNVVDKYAFIHDLHCKFPNITNWKFLDTRPCNVEDLSLDEQEAWALRKQVCFTMDIQSMPDDFISFGDDINTVERCGELYKSLDTDFLIQGYNKLIFRKPGLYRISYNARWFTFYKTTKDSTELDVPTDILDCIPSYIASQCYKVDDEQIAQIYRNEYELFLSRIDDSVYSTNKTIHIGGDW